MCIGVAASAGVCWEKAIKRSRTVIIEQLQQRQHHGDVEYIAHSPVIVSVVAMLGDCNNKRLCVFDVVSNVKPYQQPQLGIRHVSLHAGLSSTTPT